MSNVAITCLDKSQQQRAIELAEELKLSLVLPTTKNFPVLLAVTSTRLELHLVTSKSPTAGPVYVDFLNKVLTNRRLCNNGSCCRRNQLIARAIGLKTHSNLSVLDLTAGLSQDAFILADLGCKVTMLERNPIIAALLKEGLHNAITSTEWFKLLHLKLIETEAYNYLLAPNTPFYEVIYLDPMYPTKKKSAFSKKEMRILRHVVGEDKDAHQLLKTALKKAKNRVVVKRPRISPKLGDICPTFSYKGRSSRFDIYLTC
ncbi:class I SAM-dependent methyltransferase [Coxiella-like endosymbiont of Amblyomma americanum]|uniref:class I SAM-dependent methyltransferase n=1 Tax=Coxiella-like endosymbiont of Amblyomma americanum TaxID=1987500 RepID=UPI000F89E869|nr:class I SAM-dependent methyltransferase [Coxiella-like endosymbiont of Amblyomma americanum]AUJ58534.1 hypothetical protein B1F76_00155 [Coxiella-like endosymbiont of Amblyomma americanum]